VQQGRESSGVRRRSKATHENKKENSRVTRNGTK
jgi:hypothetical protein